MSDLRSTILWIVAGLVGMVGLFVVMRFGTAAGMAMMLAISAPMMAGGALRSQLLAISGLLTGFGCLWLMLVAGVTLNGGQLSGSLPGQLGFGLFFFGAGAALGLWQMSRDSRPAERAFHRQARVPVPLYERLERLERRRRPY